MESANEKDSQIRVWDALSSELLSAYNNEVQNCTNIVVLCWCGFSEKIQLTIFIFKSQKYRILVVSVGEITNFAIVLSLPFLCCSQISVY